MSAPPGTGRLGERHGYFRGVPTSPGTMEARLSLRGSRGRLPLRRGSGAPATHSQTRLKGPVGATGDIPDRIRELMCALCGCSAPKTGQTVLEIQLSTTKQKEGNPDRGVGLSMWPDEGYPNCCVTVDTSGRVKASAPLRCWMYRV